MVAEIPNHRIQPIQGEYHLFYNPDSETGKQLSGKSKKIPVQGEDSDITYFKLDSNGDLEVLA